MGDGHGHIVQRKAGAYPGQCRIGGFAGLPEIEPFFFILSGLDFDGVVLFQNGQNHLHLGLYFLPGEAIGFCQDHGLCIRKGDFRILSDRLKRDSIQDFHHAGKDSARHRLKDCISCIFQPGIGSHCSHGMFRQRINLEGDLCDDSEGSFCSDEEFGQVIA